MSRISSTSRILANVILVGVVAGCTSGSTPTPSSSPAGSLAPSAPAPTPSPALTLPPVSSPSAITIQPFTQVFRSPTMGYSVRFPKGWTVFKASEPWRPGQDEFWDSPNGDRIESADAGFRGGSQPLAPSQTAETWLDAYMATEPTGCGARERIPLGGTQATIGLNGCHGLGRLGGLVFDLVVVVGRRAYNFTMEGNVDRAFLLAMLATIEFDPTSAID